MPVGASNGASSSISFRFLGPMRTRRDGSGAISAAPMPTARREACRTTRHASGFIPSSGSERPNRMVAAAPLVLAARGAASAHAAEIPFTDPIAAFVALRGDGLSVLLDSAAPGPDTGRYTIIGVDPIEWIRTGWSDAFERLRALTAGLPRTRAPAGWPFAPAL